MYSELKLGSTVFLGGLLGTWAARHVVFLSYPTPLLTYGQRSLGTCGSYGLLRGWLSDRVSSHWLRHTFIRLSKRAGRDVKAVQQNTGDTIQTILEWYEELSDEEMGEEIQGKPLVK